MFELTDIAYFPFNLRRSIVSDFALLQNTSEMIPGFLAEFWWLFVFWLFLLLSLFWIFQKTYPKAIPEYIPRLHIFIMLGALTLLGIGARGGWQLRPLSPITAFEYVEDQRLAPLLTNTTLSLLSSSQLPAINPQSYFTPDDAAKLFTIRRQYHNTPPSSKRNLFIIVLESFGSEHVGAQTPFLDSLLQHSLQVEEGFANGLRSTQGILSITASIPKLMGQPLMFSPYQSNRVDGLAEVLGNWGYSSAFFHGANPGSMEFERFTKQSGFDYYLDRDEYNDDSQYDGQWGIWDEPFFQFAVKETNTLKLPFLSVLFSLTSHHPYKTPDWFTKKHPLLAPQIRANKYTDFALQQFFESAQQQPWFQQTLFVITADHTGQSKDPYYQSNQGRYRVPIAIFDPQQQIKGTIEGVAQHTDIMPTLLDLIGYDQAFAAFGNSLMDSTRNALVYHLHGGWFHLFNQTYYYEFNGFGLKKVFNYRKDPMLKVNLLETDSVPVEIIDTLKAIIQTHHDGMINNQLFLPDK